MTIGVSGIDLLDPELFGYGPPHDIFDQLRREVPVYWNVRETEPDGGLWVLTRYADVAAVSRDSERFTSSFGFALPREPHGPVFSENIMFRDPPDHTKHRRPLNRSFTPKAMIDLEELVRAIVLEILESLDSSDTFDWVPRVAAELPARVVASIVGVPETDHSKLVEWASDIFGRDGSPASNVRFNSAVTAIMGYAETLKVIKRSCPGDDVMSLLLATEIDGKPMTETALSMWFLTLAQAGFETTHTLIAQGMLVLSERSDIRKRLVNDREAVPRAVEELLRFVAPVNLMARTALEDVEMNGEVIRAGQYVTMWYCAANRDPEVFENPHDFDIDRSPNPHQAFGASGSPHYCLGAHLARLEMRVLLEELAATDFPYEVVGPPERAPGVFMNALRHLPMAKQTGPG
jgi:cholest-4-en-3-one 26-monooxygenase